MLHVVMAEPKTLIDFGTGLPYGLPHFFGDDLTVEGFPFFQQVDDSFQEVNPFLHGEPLPSGE